MKKLILNKSKFTGLEILSRKQLKMVVGGDTGSGISGTPGGNNGDPCPQYCIGGKIIAVNQSMNYVNTTENCNSVPSSYRDGCHNACLQEATGSFWC